MFYYRHYFHSILGETKAVCWSIILKQILNNYGVRIWSELSWLIIRFITRCYKHGHKPSGFINIWIILTA
jgi:hypothetical protein